MKAVKIIVFWSILIYIALVGALYMVQRSMIYFPQNSNDFDWSLLQDYQTAEIITEDGFSLSAPYVKADEGKPTILIFHGNASTHGRNFEKLKPYRDQGFGILSAGYRGYHNLAGKPSEQALYRDARAWVLYLIAHQIPVGEIILYGESLGTGVAVQMAIDYPHVDAVILENPFTSLPDVAATRYPFVPVKLLMTDRFDSLSKITKVQAPLFILQGLEDQIVPPEQGQILFNAAQEPKYLLPFSGYGHIDLPVQDMAEKVFNLLSDDIREIKKANPGP